MTPEDRARCIVYLLHTLSFHYNPDHMEIAENAATEVINNVDLAQKATPATPATEPHQYLSLADSPYICKILCYDYYFRMEKDSRKKAENLLTKWDKELQKKGFWQDVTEDMALQRLGLFLIFRRSRSAQIRENHSEINSILLGTSPNHRRSPIPVPPGTHGYIPQLPGTGRTDHGQRSGRKTLCHCHRQHLGQSKKCQTQYAQSPPVPHTGPVHAEHGTGIRPARNLQKFFYGK